MTVGIQMDDFPQEVGWRIDHIGFEVDEVIRIPAGIYKSPGAVESQTVDLQKGELYSFTIFDVAGDGICCDYGDGRYQVSLGTRDLYDTSAIIIASDGNFEYGMEHTFLASLDDEQPGSPSESPVDGPFITLEIQFDDYPSEIGWILRSDYGETSEARIDGRQTVHTVAFRSPRSYSANLANKLVTETIPVPPVNAQYTFILTDSIGDGLCCSGGEGYYTLWNGPTSDNVMLASGGDRGGSREVNDFTLTFNPAASPSPTPAAQPTSPTLPVATVDLRLELQMDTYADETGWIIRDSSEREIRSVSPGTYTIANERVEETIPLVVGQSYSLTLIDNYGDGMCCVNGNGWYTASIGGNESVLVAFGDKFDTVETQRFVIGDDFPITIVLKTDEHPDEIAWYLDRLDLEEGTAAAAVSPYGAYDGQSFETLEATIMGQEGGVYRFVLLDLGSDGIADGFYSIFVGTADTSDESSAIVSGSGDYGERAEHVFLARSPAVTLTLPSDSPFLTLEIKFDDYPEDVVWILKADDAETGTAVARTTMQQSVIEFGPSEPYPSELAGQVTSTEIRIPAISENAVRGFTFIFVDSQDDGLCCDFGKGSYTLYRGKKSNNEVLASGTAEGRGRVVHKFALSADGIVSIDLQSASPGISLRISLTLALLSGGLLATCTLVL